MSVQKLPGMRPGFYWQTTKKGYLSMTKYNSELCTLMDFSLGARACWRIVVTLLCSHMRVYGVRVFLQGHRPSDFGCGACDGGTLNKVARVWGLRPANTYGRHPILFKHGLVKATDGTHSLQKRVSFAAKLSTRSIRSEPLLVVSPRSPLIQHTSTYAKTLVQ